METRHPNLSKDTKFEEIQALERLQTAAKKQDQEKNKNLN